MSKNRIITIIVCIATLLKVQGGTIAYDISQVSPDGGQTAVTINTDSSVYVSQNLNFSYFQVNVAESNEYFAEFWVLPAKYNDGTYTKFSVYVNDEHVGQIIPEKDNWQSARIDGTKKISLREGINILKVGVPAPEMPAVETVRVGLTESEAIISSAKYEEFLENAYNRMSFDPPQEAMAFDSPAALQATQTQSFSAKHFSGVPLLYTFYNLFSFEKGEYLSISTSSLSEHDVDVMYLGKQNSISRPTTVLNNSSNSPSNIIATSDYPSVGVPDFYSTSGTFIPVQPCPDYILGTSEQLQGLNWKRLSNIQTGGSRYNSISKTIKIPVTGVYLIRLRHRIAGQTGTATLNVNGKYTYFNVPISFSWIPCEIPANGMTYGTMTICDNATTDNPLLFIHGAAADRIVGYNDDASSFRRVLHGLSYTDSYISQEYIVKTSGVSVCNYSSSNPVSSCEIIAGLDESLLEPDPGLQLMPKKNRKDEALEFTSGLNDVGISGSLEQCGILQVSAQSDIKTITVSDLAGNLIKSLKGEGSKMTITGAAVNIPTSGIYIVRVETDKGICSKKLIVE